MWILVALHSKADRLHKLGRKDMWSGFVSVEARRIETRSSKFWILNNYHLMRYWKTRKPQGRNYSCEPLLIRNENSPASEARQIHANQSPGDLTSEPIS